MQKILYFTAGAAPTPEEKADIDNLNKLVGSPYEVGVRNAIESYNYGAGPEPADFVAGSVPTGPGGDVDPPYDGVPVFNPDSAAGGVAPVYDGQTLTLEGDGEYVFTVVDGAITAVAYTPE